VVSEGEIFCEFFVIPFSLFYACSIYVIQRDDTGVTLLLSDICVVYDVVVRVTSLQGESESLKQSAEESRCKAADQSEQLLAVMTTLKDEHLQVHSVYTHKL